MTLRLPKYKVPFIGIGKGKECASNRLLADSIENVKAKLKLHYKNDFPSNVNTFSHFETLISVKSPKNVELPPVTPIGRFQINDSDFEITPEELENAPYEFPDSTTSLITKDTPICTDYTKLKGVNNDLYAIGQLKGLGRKKPIYKCEWFTLTYWHTSSYFGHIMKSRPGVMVQCHNTNLFNSKTAIKGNVPTNLQNRSHPFKFAVYRTRMKKILRKLFLNIFLKDEKLKQDYTGFFRFSSYLYPENKSDLKSFEENMFKALKRVSKLDLQELERESEQINSKIPWYEVNRILSRNGVTDFGIDRKLFKNQKKKHR